MVYDPITLRMESCLGWSPGEIDAMAAELDQQVRACDGAWAHNDDNGWYFPSRFELDERSAAKSRPTGVRGSHGRAAANTVP
jgi:hypothetical protein